jgi:2-haloacid dehalogenase
MKELPLLVFDVNETLLDLDKLAPHFQKIFGNADVLREWFAQVILYSQAITFTGDYTPFGELGVAVMRMIGTVRGIQIAEREVDKIKEAFLTMPPHADVDPALRKLRAAGFRLFTLTNNPKATCEKQLDNAGIRQMFEQLFSIDESVHRYKPACEVYRAVEKTLGVPASRLCLVACHTWDILGASAVGWQTALILRAGNAVLNVGGQPRFIGVDLNVLTEELLEHFVS